MNFTVVIIGGLITWRLSSLIVKETGPWAIFARFRAYLANRQKKIGGLYDLYTCVACVSVQMAALTAIAPSRTLLEWFGYILAFSAVAMLTDALFASFKK